jgi:hypothetical protein
MTFFVYGNFNSKDWGTVKYIGAASHLGRPLAHEWESRKEKNRTRKHRGIRKLIREGHHVGWKILAACNSWKETLATERRLILEYKAAHGGKRPDWNFTDGGEGCLGYVHTAESLVKMNARTCSLENREQMSLRMMGKRYATGARTPETRAKMSAAAYRPEVHAKKVASATGRKASPEARENMRSAQLGHKQSPETVAKRVAKTTGKKRSDDCRERMRCYAATPEGRENKSRAGKLGAAARAQKAHR